MQGLCQCVWFRSSLPMLLPGPRSWGLQLRQRPRGPRGTFFRPALPFGCPVPSCSLPSPGPELKTQDSGRSPRLTSHSQKDRKQQKVPGGLQGPHGGQTCTGHHSPAAGGMWCDVQPSEGGSLRWVVAAGGGDSSREEGQTDMTRMWPRDCAIHSPHGLGAKDQGHSQQVLISISRQRAGATGGQGLTRIESSSTSSAWATLKKSLSLSGPRLFSSTRLRVKPYFFAGPFTS